MSENEKNDFGQVVDALEAGMCAYRKEWESSGKAIFVVWSAANSEYTFEPFIAMKTHGEEELYTPWVPSHADILAHDWIVVD